MSVRLSSSYVVIPALLVAGGLAFYGLGAGARGDRCPGDAHRDPDGPRAEALPLAEGEQTLPPNHPPIAGMTAPGRPAQPRDDGPAAITWTAPEGWVSTPSTSTMRLATYRAPGGVDVSVSRAGGAVEANIQRWVAQFDDVGREARSEKTVRGLHLVTVDMAGTYVGGGTAMGGNAWRPSAARGLVGGIVESTGPAYFFKMTGPAAAVRAARRRRSTVSHGERRPPT